MTLPTYTPTCTPVRRRRSQETVKPPTYGKEVPRRDVAQLGSAPEWGSGGRRFESGRPDCEKGLPRLRLRPWAGFSVAYQVPIPAVDSRY